MGPKLRLKEESSDLAQEALRRSLAGLDGFVYAADGAFLAFLTTKVEQVIQDRVDHWKAQRRDPGRECSFCLGHSSEEATPLIDVADIHASRPDEILERREDLERLATAMDALKQENLEYWQLVLQVDVEGRSFADIAHQCGSTPDAVKQKSYRAKRALALIFGRLKDASSREDT